MPICLKLSTAHWKVLEYFLPNVSSWNALLQWWKERENLKWERLSVDLLLGPRQANAQQFSLKWQPVCMNWQANATVTVDIAHDFEGVLSHFCQSKDLSNGELDWIFLLIQQNKVKRHLVSVAKQAKSVSCRGIPDYDRRIAPIGLIITQLTTVHCTGWAKIVAHCHTLWFHTQFYRKPGCLACCGWWTLEEHSRSCLEGLQKQS